MLKLEHVCLSFYRIIMLTTARKPAAKTNSPTVELPSKHPKGLAFEKMK